MQNVEIVLPPSADCRNVEKIIDAVIAKSNLNATMRGSFKSRPGSIHWHVKNGSLPGTLELTLWPKQHRAWFTIHPQRDAAWIAEKLRIMHEMLQRRFLG